jgi:hypothetical protein
MSQLKNRDDIFVNLAITVGPRFLQGKKPGTNQEIAEILNSYASHYSGVLHEVFIMLAKYYTHLPLTPLREFPILSADAPSGLGAQIGYCSSCGENGYYTYIDGQEQCSECTQ